MAGRRETALKNLAKAKKTGRPKGSTNKFTDLKQMFLNVSERMGGEDALLKYAKEEPREFYRMLHVMLPRNVQEEIRKDIHITWGHAQPEQIIEAEIITPQLPDNTKDTE
jgi:hypothetical protein